MGGNCRTTLIVNCSPHEFNREETINSLRFGVRCKLIENKAQVNRIYSNKELMAIIKKLKIENKELKKRLKSGGGGGNASGGDTSSKPKKKTSKKIKHTTNMTHVNNLSTILDDSKIDVRQSDDFKELETRCEGLSSELRQVKLSNVQLEEERVSNTTKLDALTKESTKNRQLLFDLETQVDKLTEIKISLEAKIRTLEDTNVELKQDWKETLESDLKKMHRTKTQANLEKFKLSDDVRALETKLDEANALNISKDKELDRKIVKIKELLSELEKKTLEISKLEKEHRGLKKTEMELTLKSTNLSDENGKLNKTIKQMEEDYEKLTLSMEKRTKKLKRKNQILAQKLNTRHNYLAQQYNVMEMAARSSGKRHTWAAELVDGLDMFSSSMGDLGAMDTLSPRGMSHPTGTMAKQMAADISNNNNNNNNNNSGDPNTVKTPPLSAQNSIKSTGSMHSTTQKIAPALLNALQRPVTPSKFGNKNKNRFAKNRASARLSRIVTADSVHQLAEEDSNILNAHDYLAGLETKRATLTLQQSLKVRSPKRHPMNKSTGGINVNLHSTTSVPANVRFNIDQDDDASSSGEDDVKVEIEDLEPAPLINHAQSESDGFDLDEFGKLVDSNLTAGLEFAKFMNEEEED